LKSNHEITEEARKYDFHGTVLHEKIIVRKKDQQPSYALNDHVFDHMKGSFSLDSQPMLSYQLENEDEDVMWVGKPPKD
jgi:hypothetical protein